MLRLILLTLAALCCSISSALELVTLPIPTFRLDLTIQNSRRNLRALETPSLDNIIQSIAEEHLAVIYADEFTNVPPPTHVLLTVSTINADEGKSGGIYIRSSFLGGVVSWDSNNAPSRNKLERVTLEAFEIPGAGEDFLKALREEDHDDLEGLLILSVKEVVRSDDYDYDEGPNNGNGGEADSMTKQQDMNDDSGDSDSMNIWAVAAVAALGAMFLVIILCTSILYCDWRKRKDRREKKRERAAASKANHHAARSGNGNGNGSRSGGKNNKSSSVNSNPKNDEFEIVANEVPLFNVNVNGGAMPPQSLQQRQPVALQIVVPAAASGETEEMINTPSPQDSGHGNHNTENNRIGIENANFESIMNSHNNGNGNPGRMGLMNKFKSSRHNISKRVKSKAADAQLAEGDMNSSLNINNNTSTPDNINSNNHPPFSPDYVPDVAPSITDYSVGEDTTMLYPTINRGRTASRDKDAMSDDFDGYSMDGMSAIVSGDGGLSAYGGSSNGGGNNHMSTNNGGGVHSKRGSGGGSSRDVMYSGEVPRDFDSVWGDEDDQSKLTVDTSMDNGYNSSFHRNMVVTSTKKEAYGDLTKNLDELVEMNDEQSSAATPSGVGLVSSPIGEQSVQSSLVGAGVNLHEFDSESETSGSQNKGAFTLELLGKGGLKNSQGSTAPSQDDEDSILGDMYKDENSSLGLGNDSVTEHENVPGSGDSVDSTPSWAAPIQSAVQRSTSDIFRVLSASSEDKEESDKENTSSSPRNDDASTSSTPKETLEQRTKEKLLSSLSVSSDDHSVGSANSKNSNSANSQGSQKGKAQSSSKRKETTAKSSEERALGLTNSMEEEVDEDPAAMIDNINSMLSECREILDTENMIV